MPSARRATDLLHQLLQGRHISIHALREEGDRALHGVLRAVDISIHALREEGDWSRLAKIIGHALFLSTPSARRATLWCWGHAACLFISIHALREEGDGAARAAERSRQYFYPRPPRGGRPVPSSETKSVEDFYPRPPRGGRPV